MKTIRKRGFSLTELLVVLAIMGLISGLAIYSFINLSRSMRLISAGEALNQALINARQQAITSRVSRRVALNLYHNTYWVERKKSESLPWDPPGGGSNSERISEVERLPDYVVFGDVGGFTADDIRESDNNKKIWYIDFDTRGSVFTYPKSPPPMLNPNIRREPPYSQRSNLAIHLIMENARIPISENEDRPYDLKDGQLVSFIERISAVDKNGDGLDDYSGHDVRITAAARRQVVSVFVLSLTGRSRVFDYGYGTPWSEIDVVEP